MGFNYLFIFPPGYVALCGSRGSGDIVQETGIKTILMEKKGKKAKWLSGEDLQIAIKRREVKSKGEKERYKHLNAEFQEQQGEIRKPSSVINAKK